MQLRLYSKWLWTLFQSKRKDRLCSSRPGGGYLTEGVTNLLPCSNLFWGKSFSGITAGQKKPSHLNWQWGKYYLFIKRCGF